MIYLKILKINKSIFEGPVNSIKIFTGEGSREILPKHAPLLCNLRRKLSYFSTDINEIVKIDIENGFFKIENNQAVALIN